MMDRISFLPETILHDILSRLPEKDATRTSVLSKAWRETWSTFPILSICDRQIIGRFPKQMESQKRKIFLDYVKKTLLRFCDRGLAIKEFKLKLSANCFNVRCMYRDVDLWLKLASGSGVEVLEISLPDRNKGSRYPCYILRSGVIEAKSLNKLVLNGRIRVDQAFLNHSIKFFSLRVLSLWFVLFEDEGAIEHLISHCPLIERITLKWCYVYNPPSKGGLPVSRTSKMKSLSMHGLQKLKGVDIVGIQEVYIDSPNLENLCYCPDAMYVPFKLNFDSCRNLRRLCLSSLKSTIIADKWLLELFSKFPFLESLDLFNCSMSERINISSAHLKVLVLSNCCNLKEVNIDAPNLLSCRYHGHGASMPVISFLRSSDQLELNVLLYMDYMDLYNLREFIENFKPQKVLASLSLIFYQEFAGQPHPDILQASSPPPPSIKHLKLHDVPTNKALYLPLVNRLLSSCCPETISFCLRSNFYSKPFIEFFYLTLMGREQGDCCCSSGHPKCWWHGLKNVKVTSSVKADENVVDFKTMLDALPTSGQENISFRLEL